LSVKFKEGDRVRCVSYPDGSTTGHPVGKTGTIFMFPSGRLGIRFDKYSSYPSQNDHQYLGQFVFEYIGPEKTDLCSLPRREQDKEKPT
jgi:hypothetical protein